MTTTTLDLGVQGAKRSRYHFTSPDALLRSIVDNNRDATMNELEELFDAEARRYGGELLSAIITYWFANRYRALMRERVPPSVIRKRKAHHEKQESVTVAALKKATVAAVGRKILNKIAPACGKRVENMTKEDCCKEGGWYLMLAAKLQPNQTVKQAGLTDEELWELYNA